MKDKKCDKYDHSSFFVSPFKAFIFFYTLSLNLQFDFSDHKCKVIDYPKLDSICDVIDYVVNQYKGRKLIFYFRGISNPVRHGFEYKAQREGYYNDSSGPLELTSNSENQENNHEKIKQGTNQNVYNEDY